MSSLHPVAEEARDTTIAFAVRHSEKARLRALAAERGSSVSAYVHRLVSRELAATQPTPTTEERT